MSSDTCVFNNSSKLTAANYGTIGEWDHQWTWPQGREYDSFDFYAIDAKEQVSGGQALAFIDDAAFGDVGQIQQLGGSAVTWVRINPNNDFPDAEMVIKVDQAVDFNDWGFIM